MTNIIARFRYGEISRDHLDLIPPLGNAGSAFAVGAAPAGKSHIDATAVLRQAPRSSFANKPTTLGGYYVKP
jgi:hypothetical protein